jgi:lysozyme
MATDGKAKLVAWLGAAAVAGAVGFVQVNEGTVLRSYQDPARADLLTACVGETHYIVTPGDIKPGATFTREQCTEALYRSLWEHAEPVIRCTTPADLTQGQRVAFLDFSFNAGGATFCKSSIAREAKYGHVQQSCDAILLYRWAGGHDCSQPENKRICGGIWTRRQAEHRVCLGA